MLVVKEKHGYFKGKDAWKFPTGVVNQVSIIWWWLYVNAFSWCAHGEILHPQGEDICAAAIREVKEETGVS